MASRTYPTPAPFAGFGTPQTNKKSLWARIPGKKDVKMKDDPGMCMKTKTRMTICQFVNGHFCIVEG